MSSKWILVIIFFTSSVILLVVFLNFKNKDFPNTEICEPYFSSIEEELFIAGRIIPEEEITITPQVSGIIEKVYVKEGELLKKGDIIASIKVVPNLQEFYQTLGTVKNSETNLKYTKVEFERNKGLYDKHVISAAEFQRFEMNYEMAKIAYKNAVNNHQIVATGFAGKSRDNIKIKSTTNGSLLRLHIDEGDQVINSNIFNSGTPVATIADLSLVNFDGKVNESKVAQLKIGMPLEITINTKSNLKFKADLYFISPKKDKNSKSVQFRIKARIKNDQNYSIPAYYGAMASIILERKHNVLVVPEKCLQFYSNTKRPYVVVENTANELEKKDVETGISNGIIVEIKSGISLQDKVLPLKIVDQ